MDDIFFCLGDDAANVFSEKLLDWQSDGIHHILLVVVLDEMLLKPVMPDEFALAVADLYSWEAICLAAVKLLDVVFVVVADVFTKSRLLMEPRLLPLRAIGVSYIVRALVPRLQDRHRVRGVLHNHEARVGICAIEAVGVVLGAFGVPWVLCHGYRVLRLNVPVIQHPLNWNVEESKSGVSVEKNDEFVILDVVGQRRGFDPSGVSVFKIGRLNKLVIVTVDEGVCVMVEDAARDMVDVTPVVIALLKVFGRLKRACLEVQDQNLIAQVLLVARVRRQLNVAAVWFADVRLGRGCHYWCV
jgi:hypothetical protein